MEQILCEIDKIKTELDFLRKNLDNFTILEALRTEFLYESNRIEGNSLTLRETQLIVNEGITISGKTVREHLEAINHKEAILFIEEIVSQKISLSEYVLKQIHSIILYGIDRVNAGKYRSVPVMISGSQYLPPPPYVLQSLMDNFFIFYEKNCEMLHPVILAAEIHEKLVSIHPFIDGNGRTARLIMNLILLQNGFPLIIIGGDSKTRLNYYESLEFSQINNDNSCFILFIAEKVLENLKRYLKIFKNY